MRRSAPALAVLALAGGLSFACGAFPTLTCGPGTGEKGHQCLILAPPITCGPGTVLTGEPATGAVCAPEPPPPEPIPGKDRIISDLHGLSVPVRGDVGIGSWVFSYPTEFHALVVVKATQAQDVLQLDTRLQLQDFNTHEPFTFWTTLLYTRELSAWRFESATITTGVRGWAEAMPTDAPPGAGVTPPGPKP